MDDNLSTKSSESVATSGEYEIVNDSNLMTLPNDDLQHQEVKQLHLLNYNDNNKSSMSIMVLTDEEINSTSSSSSSGVGRKSPKLAIANNRDIADLQYEMHDALRELEITEQKGVSTAGTSNSTLIVPKHPKSAMKFDLKPIDNTKFGVIGSGVGEQSVINTPHKEDSANTELNCVGHSVFHDCIDASSMVKVIANNSGTIVAAYVEEKQDAMKPEKSDTDEEVSDMDHGCTIFAGVTYLGAANINAPKSEIDVYRIMSELNSCTTANGLKITISIPNSSEGLVVLNDAETSTIIATYEIQSIILYFRGPIETIENGCFAFTWLHGESLFQCHVFRCHIPEAVNQVSACFQKAFQTYHPSMTCSLTSAMDSNMLNSVTSDLSGNQLNTAGYEFLVLLEIKEKVAKNNYTSVPRDRNCFKLRANTDKEVYITVKQTPSTILQPLFIERCFGVLLSPGKLLRQADMQLIDLVSMGYQQINNSSSNSHNNNHNNNNSSNMTTTTNNFNNNANSNINSTTITAVNVATNDAITPSNSGTTTTIITPNTNTPTTASTFGNTNNISLTNNITPISLNPYCIRAEWKSQERAFEQFNNAESSKTFLTIAVDIVMRGIQEPVRFVIESPVIIQSPSELRIMDHFISKRPMIMRFYLHLKRTTDEFSWEVSSIDPSEEILEQNLQQQQNTNANTTSSSSYLLKFGMNNLSRIVRSTSIVSIEDDCPTDYSSDGDEPLLSGTGEVSKECSQDTLDEWDPILKEWDGEKRPKNLPALVRLGVPEALREKIWQKLANVEGKTEMTNMYKTLITKETKCETVIQRDIHRTFPAHKCFKETGGSGQFALFKVSKAYAVYDSEVGYCQGLSFIAASLLLHMPEEDAFCVLVALMYDYGLRDLYKQGFEVLYMRLYQLDRLIKDQLPKLHEHFTACGIETHMYASQWFLTLFTARFPLCFVYHVLDVFLLDGMPLLFQVAISLLSICEADLRQLDFEGILKYFRVTLPKKCRSSNQARRIMKGVCERKIKKLKHYEEEFYIKKQHKERLEKESQVYESRFGDERRKLQTEIDMLLQQLNNLRKRQAEKEKKHTGIIQDYKQIIQRFEQDAGHSHDALTGIMHIVGKCENCAKEIKKFDNKHNSVPPNGNDDIAAANILNNDMKKFFIKSWNKNDTLGPLDPLNAATLRIRELELELAQAKLAHVEAECRNQDLNHQLNTTMTEINANRNSWQPWLSKTFSSLQEKVATRVNRDAPSFQSYTNQISTSIAVGGDSSTTTTSAPLTQNSNQEEKSCLVDVSPKLPPKFQTSKLRNSIDSLRSIVPMDMTKINAMCDRNEPN